MLPFIITGIVLGSVYGLAGVGLVLTYKTSGIFNFAHGAMATLAAYLFYSLHVQHGMAWPLAAVISALVLGVALGFGFEAFGRRLSRTSLVWRVGATVGILLSIEALVTIIWGGTTQTFPHFLSISTFNLAGTAVTYEQLITTVVSLAGAIGLWVFFRVARLGKAMRAVVDDPQLLDIAGTNPSRVRRWAWIVGCTFATLSGLLLAPDVSLDSSTLTLLVVQAFGAAAIGGFSSLPLTWAGGIVIGVIGSIATRYGSTGSLLAALGPTLPFIILFLVLVFAPKSRLRIKEVALIRPSIPWSAPPLVQGAGGLIAIVFFLLVPLFAGYNVSQWTIVLTDLILLVSLGLLARTAGQVSLCQVGFAAIGASTFSKLAVSAGVPWIPALILAGLVVVPVGALIAIPAVRLGGLYLALATLGFGLLLQDMFYNSSLMFGFGGVGVAMPAPHLSWLSVDSEKGFYYVVLLITVLLVLAVVALERSRTGRLMRAIADSPRALRSSGATVSVTLVLIFCVSAFIAAIAGALQGMVFSTVTGENYDPLSSVLFFAVVLLGVGSAPWYALPTALALVLLPVYIQSANVSNYLQLAFGVFAVQLAISGQANPAFLQKLHKFLDRFRARTPDLQPSAVPASADAAGEISADAGPLVLEAQGIRVQFGGLVAVDDISLTVPTGKIVGLIGANGAGKSTTLDVCSGLTLPTSGKVLLGGREITRVSPSARARLGLGRTFQQLDLYDSLSVRTNVSMGREASMAGVNLLGHVFSSKSETQVIGAATAEAVTTCGLADVLDGQVGVLPSGKRRVVEFARCLAGPFRIFLLDEPSAGLDRAETAQFAQILRTVVAERGVGVLLVEHDMDLVMEVCDEIYVMHLGSLLFHGSPAEVRAHDAVRSVYLGTSASAEGSRLAVEAHASGMDESDDR